MVLPFKEFFAAGERSVLTGSKFEHEADEDQAVDEHRPVILEQLDEAKGKSGIDRLHRTKHRAHGDGVIEEHAGGGSRQHTGHHDDCALFLLNEPQGFAHAVAQRRDDDAA